MPERPAAPIPRSRLWSGGVMGSEQNDDGAAPAGYLPLTEIAAGCGSGLVGVLPLTGPEPLP
ncbi:hypothetical protein OHA98_20620 [Streptomyces sp. NBC_00654]|uniref:hypothetical protein n=1 Tax=Streptomyces sp. NBC_00654 TaxID=2975799 RepID=UPI00225793D0|nr:hypothetical protein [Streptomyces sp. NBC_00654]MCX4967148.1 hypothetical protein [Streptomyces sp. NBC_00654]